MENQDEIKLTHYQKLKQDHPDYYKQYYQNHKGKCDRCSCGGKYTLNHRSRHNDTKRHVKYILSLVLPLIPEPKPEIQQICAVNDC